MKHHRRFSLGQLAIGIFLLLIGLGLLLDNLNIIDYGPFWKLWPLLFIGIGIIKLIDAQYLHEYRKAIWMLFLGSWFLVSELHLFGLDYHNSWPILLIGIGIGMLWKSLAPSHEIVKDHCNGI